MLRTTADVITREKFDYFCEGASPFDHVTVKGKFYFAIVGVAPRSSFCFASSKEDSQRSCRVEILNVWRAGRFIVSVPGPSLVQVLLFEMLRER